MMGHRIVPAVRQPTKNDLDRIAYNNSICEQYRVARIAISDSCIAHLPVFVSGELTYANGFKVILVPLTTHLYLKVTDKDNSIVFPASLNNMHGKSVACGDLSWQCPYVMIRCEDGQSARVMNSSSWSDSGRTTMVEYHAERMHISTFEVQQRYSHMASAVVLCRGPLKSWNHYRNMPLEGAWIPNAQFDLPHMCETRKRADNIVEGYLQKVGISVVKGRLILPEKLIRKRRHDEPEDRSAGPKTV